MGVFGVLAETGASRKKRKYGKGRAQETCMSLDSSDKVASCFDFNGLLF